ncbi:hypothetical protein [Hymenobacter sp. B81]|uniref:hypothetical protein n=1 Tax=Hymenobacter sp. B81 TaxID=3344878 RepID=UPI0037DC60CD
MLRLLLAACSLLLSALLLAGCCGAISCDCQDERDDALLLRFSADSTGGTGFRAAEVDTVLLVRRVLPQDSVRGTVPDTARLIRPAAQVFEPLVLDNTTPFPARAGRKLDAYRYHIVLPGPRRRSPVRRRYTLTELSVDGRLDTDGCCTCYENTAKSLRLGLPGGSSRVVNAYSPPGAAPVVTVLPR